MECITEKAWRERVVFSPSFFAFNETVAEMAVLLDFGLDINMCIIDKVLPVQTFFNIFSNLMPFNNG